MTTKYQELIQGLLPRVQCEAFLAAELGSDHHLVAVIAVYEILVCFVYGFHILRSEINDWMNEHFKIVGDETWESRGYPGFYVRTGDIIKIDSYGRDAPWVDVQVVASKKS